MSLLRQRVSGYSTAFPLVAYVGTPGEFKGGPAERTFTIVVKNKAVYSLILFFLHVSRL